MSDLQDKTLKAIQDATQCWQICGPDPGHPPCTCRQARDAAIAIVLEEAARCAESQPHWTDNGPPLGKMPTGRDDIAAAIRALGDGK